MLSHPDTAASNRARTQCYNIEICEKKKCIMSDTRVTRKRAREQLRDIEKVIKGLDLETEEPTPKVPRLEEETEEQVNRTEEVAPNESENEESLEKTLENIESTFKQIRRLIYQGLSQAEKIENQSQESLDYILEIEDFDKAIRKAQETLVSRRNERHRRIRKKEEELREKQAREKLQQAEEVMRQAEEQARELRRPRLRCFICGALGYTVKTCPRQSRHRRL